MGIYTDGEQRKNRDGIESQLNKQIRSSRPERTRRSAIDRNASGEKTHRVMHSNQNEVTRYCAPADMKKYSGYFGYTQL